MTRHLEMEINNFPIIMNDLINLLDIKEKNSMGRPSYPLKDIIKCLLIKTLRNLSYRRSESDIEELYKKGIISSIPRRGVLNKYMMDHNLKRLLQKLISLSAEFFIDCEDTLLMDSTWLSKRMYRSSNRVSEGGKSHNFGKTRKLHVVCLKNSKIIVHAICTKGTSNDSPHFEPLLNKVMDSGFNIKTLLADAGYSSRFNYALCDAYGIEEVYIDFRKNASTRSSKGGLWKQRLMLYKTDLNTWKDQYRFRVLIEGVFSSMKRKQINYIRSRKGISQDIELFLKALCYNICIINKELYGQNS